MYFPRAVLVAFAVSLLGHATAADHPEITAAPASGRFHDLLVRAQIHQPELEDSQYPKRQEDSFWCYGDGSPCGEMVNLFAPCKDLNGDPYYKCICEGGYVAANQQCEWCKVYYRPTAVLIQSINSRQCSSKKVGISPIPASVIAVMSAYNATATGGPSGGGPKANSASATSSGGAGPLSSPSTSEGSSQTSQTSAPALSSRSSRGPLTGSTVTFGGGGAATLAAPTLELTTRLITIGGNPTAVSGGGSSGSGSAASTVNTGYTLFLAMAAFGSAVWCLVGLRMW